VVDELLLRAPSNNPTFSGTVTANQIQMTGTNMINFDGSNVAPPSINTRSIGSKIVLYPNVEYGGQVDFAIGIDSFTLWNSVSDTNGFFKWHGGTNVSATLTAGGDFSVAGTLTAGGNPVQRSLTNASTASDETALYVSPNTMRTIKAGSGIALSTASNVVSMRYGPHVAFMVSSNAITTNVGQLATGIVTLQSRSGATAYTSTLATAHPLGTGYMVMVTPSSASTFVACQAVVASAT